MSKLAEIKVCVPNTPVGKAVKAFVEKVFLAYYNGKVQFASAVTEVHGSDNSNVKWILTVGGNKKEHTWKFENKSVANNKQVQGLLEDDLKKFFASM